MWEFERVEARAFAWLEDQVAQRTTPLFVGIDGRSGAGKSTLAARISEHRGDTVVIEGDQFYAGGSGAAWDRRSLQARADLVIDWRRQLVVLQQLRDTGAATWFSFDWDADDWDSDVVPLSTQPSRCVADRIVVLEGAYSCRPELHELLDARILLAPPVDVRRRQLLAREGDAYRDEWEARWSGAEDHYFTEIMPASHFDLALNS